MHCLRLISSSLLSLSLFSAGAEAGSLCTTQGEMAALRTAAVQQELMVAGFTCQASDDYNRFVLAYRPELQRSDADLKTYFLRREGKRGEAAYDTFKTKLANLSSLSEVGDTAGYCASTHAAFAMALGRHQSLDSFVAGQPLLIALPDQRLCAERAARPMIAEADPEALPPQSRPVAARPAAVLGVPRRRLPASP